MIAKEDEVERVARALHEESDSPLEWEACGRERWRERARAAIAAMDADKAELVAALRASVKDTHYIAGLYGGAYTPPTSISVALAKHGGGT